MEVTKQFSIDDIHLYQDDEDQDFAHVEIWALANGNNSHKNPIDIEVLKRDAYTILGKPIIGYYSEWDLDTTTHTKNQSILGWIPTDQEVQFKDKDGKTFIVINGLLSKLYAKKVVDMFRENNFRNVSCEFTCIEEDEDEYGNMPLSQIVFHAVTILGLRYDASCEGCEIKVKQFAKFNTEENSISELKKFAEERKSKLDGKVYKVNKTELKETPWGDVDKTTLKDKVMGAKNRSSLVKEVYLLVEDGWENAPSEHLKYPVMQLIDDTFYYNKGALSSALGYAKGENETEVVTKVEKLYKKFKLNNKEDTDKMENNKEFAIEGRKAWGDVITQVEKHEGKGVYVDSVEKDHIIFTKDDVRYRVSADVEVGKDDKKVSASIKWDTKKKDSQQKEFEDNNNDDKKEVDKAKEHDIPDDKKDIEDGKGDDEDAEEFAKKDKKEKKMSLDVNVDGGASLAFLENETDEYKEMISKLYAEDKEIIMSKVLEMVKERDELKKFKAEREEQDKQFEVNKIMADVKEDIEEKDFANLKEEGMACKMSEIKGFANKVKAFAYEASKGKTKKSSDGIMTFAVESTQTNNEDTDVFDRILNK